MNKEVLLRECGKHLILGIQGVNLTENERKLLTDLSPAGIIFFDRNFHFNLGYSAWFEKLVRLQEEIYSLTDRKKILFTIDHEGGRVVRLPAPITKFPYAIQAKQHSQEFGKCSGLELASLGFNLSYAPVADIHSCPENPIIGNRAFGTTYREVSEYSSAYLKGLNLSNIIGCAKHFPGHGDTKVDSHLALPTLPFTLNELRERELIPFIDLINAGCPTIMTGHLLFPELDKLNPVTFSHKFLNDILRNEIGFKGVVISDDLEMSAVSERIIDNKRNSVSEMLIAGNDMFIISRSPWLKTDITNIFIDNYISNYDRNISIISESQKRIENLLLKVANNTAYILNKEILKQHQELIINSCYN
jgi:beta-N-acetylhexosaminidase